MDRPHAHPPAPWPAAQPSPLQAQRSRDDLVAPATQLVADSEAYLSQAPGHIGRRVAADQVELFVDDQVVASLQQAFARHATGFIALHGIGTVGARHVLDSLAQAAGAGVQRLVLRHAGDGAVLASVPFVEVPQADGRPVRVLVAPVDGDPAQDEPLALALLGHASLAVLMLGDMPAPDVLSVLSTLHLAMLAGPWPNRELLLVPLGGAAPLAGAAAQLAAHGSVAVHVTPRAGSAQDVWDYISGAWNRQHEQPGRGAAVPTSLAHAVPAPRVPLPQAPTELMRLDTLWMDPASRQVQLPGFAPTEHLPPQAADALSQAPGGPRWQSYVDRCSALKGLLQCCVFDSSAMLLLAHLGARPAADRLLRQGVLLLQAIGDSTRALGFGTGVPEATVSTATHHLLLRPVAGHPGVALVAVLQAAHTNLTLARMQLERVEPPR